MYVQGSNWYNAEAALRPCIYTTTNNKDVDPTQAFQTIIGILYYTAYIALYNNTIILFIYNNTYTYNIIIYCTIFLLLLIYYTIMCYIIYYCYVIIYYAI